MRWLSERRWWARLTMGYWRRWDLIRNRLRSERPVTTPRTDVVLLLHLAWLSWSAAFVRSWSGFGIAVGVLLSVHLILSFFEMIGPRR